MDASGDITSSKASLLSAAMKRKDSEIEMSKMRKGIDEELERIEGSENIEVLI